MCNFFSSKVLKLFIVIFQGRQKLARFNAREFATLIIDILSDAKRRQTGISSPPLTIKGELNCTEHYLPRGTVDPKIFVIT